MTTQTLERRASAKHHAATAEARRRPGLLVLASVHRIQYVARSYVSHIQSGKSGSMTAYTGPDAFAAEARQVDNGTEVWIAYVGTRNANGSITTPGGCIVTPTGWSCPTCQITYLQERPALLGMCRLAESHACEPLPEAVTR